MSVVEDLIAQVGLLPLSLVLVLTIAVLFVLSGQTKDASSGANKKSDDADVEGILPPAGPTFQEFNTGFKGAVGYDLRGEPMTTTKNAELWTGWVKEYGKIFRVPSPNPLARPDIFMVADVATAKEVFQKQEKMYRGDFGFTRTRSFVRDTLSVFGRCLFSLEGTEWKWRKDALMREFHKSRMTQDAPRMFFERIAASGDSLCKELAAVVEKGEEVSIYTVNKLTFKATANVIFYFLFGRDVTFDADDFYGGAVYLLEHLNHLRASLVHNRYKHIPGTECYKAEQKRIAAWAAMDRPFAKEVEIMVKEFRGEIPVAKDRKPGSCLATLFAKEPRFAEQGVKYLIQDLRLIVHAGFESTANAVAFAIGLLAERPDLTKRIAEEGRAAMKKQGDSDITSFVPKNVECLEETNTAKNMFMEGLRLYPPAISLHGMALRSFSVSSQGTKYKVPKGSMMLFLVNAMQRDPDCMGKKGHPNPNVVDPDRWDAPVAEQPFLTTFKMGAHVCPGKSLAVIEGHMMLLMLGSRFTFETVEKPAVVDETGMPETNLPNHEVILARPKDGLKMRIKKITA